jgi:hypothetical protein
MLYKVGGRRGEYNKPLNEAERFEGERCHKTGQPGCRCISHEFDVSINQLGDVPHPKTISIFIVTTIDH